MALLYSVLTCWETSVFGRPDFPHCRPHRVRQKVPGQPLGAPPHGRGTVPSTLPPLPLLPRLPLTPPTPHTSPKAKEEEKEQKYSLCNVQWLRAYLLRDVGVGRPHFPHSQPHRLRQKVPCQPLGAPRHGRENSNVCQYEDESGIRWDRSWGSNPRDSIISASSQD